MPEEPPARVELHPVIRHLRTLRGSTEGDQLLVLRRGLGHVLTPTPSEEANRTCYIIQKGGPRHSSPLFSTALRCPLEGPPCLLWYGGNKGKPRGRGCVSRECSPHVTFSIHTRQMNCSKHVIKTHSLAEACPLPHTLRVLRSAASTFTLMASFCKACQKARTEAVLL